MNRRHEWMALGAAVLSVGAVGMNAALNSDRPQLDLITLEPLPQAEEMASPDGRSIRARAETAVPIRARDFEHDLPAGAKTIPRPAIHDAQPRLVTINEEKTT